MGFGTAAAGGMQAIGAHQSQQAAVARSNAIAQQQYQRDLQIAAARDREKGRVYQAELKADTAAKNAYYAQLTANQTEANRALASSNQKLNEKRAGAAFDAQTKLAAAIQAQGEVLASGKAGQSFLLQAMDAQRQLGFEQAQINQTLYDAATAAGVEREGILLDQNAANVSAWNNLPAAPLSPEASFLPVKPIKAKGPSGLALAGSLLGAGIDGASAGIGTYRTLKG
jgi:hypothetical protein|tara:strand:- start:1159 stop:1839 length:681 start_codon:yes stop_codon:yes gene_type:complete